MLHVSECDTDKAMNQSMSMQVRTGKEEVR